MTMTTPWIVCLALQWEAMKRHLQSHSGSENKEKELHQRQRQWRAQAIQRQTSKMQQFTLLACCLKTTNFGEFIAGELRRLPSTAAQSLKRKMNRMLLDFVDEHEQVNEELSSDFINCVFLLNEELFCDFII